MALGAGAGAHDRYGILSNFRVKSPPIDRCIPLADAEQGHVFRQPFDDAGGIRPSSIVPQPQSQAMTLASRLLSRTPSRKV